MSSTALRLACSRCGEALPERGEAVGAFGGLGVVRCPYCGRRWTEQPEPREIPACEGCGSPYLESTGVEVPAECPVCATLPRGEPIEAGLAQAAAAELRGALAASREFVGSETLQVYLDALLGRLVQAVGPARAGSPTVAVFDDSRLLSLAIPDGTVVLSTGLLASCGDEAELAFVVGHEVAHLASETSARRLVGAGLVSVARGSEPQAAWNEAAEGVLLFGYGDAQEHAADRVAVEAVRRLGYDPEAAMHWLERLERRGRRADPAVGPWALAHPPVSRRRLELDRVLARSAPACGTGKLNREVFQRMLQRSRPWTPRPLAPAAQPRPRRRRSWGWAAAALAALAFLAAWLLWAMPTR